MTLVSDCSCEREDNKTAAMLHDKMLYKTVVITFEKTYKPYKIQTT